MGSASVAEFEADREAASRGLVWPAPGSARPVVVDRLGVPTVGVGNRVIQGREMRPLFSATIELYCDVHGYVEAGSAVGVAAPDSSQASRSDLRKRSCRPAFR